MKTLKILFGWGLISFMLLGCYAEVIIEDPVIVDPVETAGSILNSHELWYVDVHRSNATGEIPFMQMAFTLSFVGNSLKANNNLVGIGANGYGYGIDVGTFDTIGQWVDVLHDIDGFYSFEVIRLNAHEIELFHPGTGLSYILVGYQRNNFDYDKLFYDNLHYFLQEYEAWERYSISPYGEPNLFDKEQFLQFLPGGGDGNFRSSKDIAGTPLGAVYWDYEGLYWIDPITGEPYVKHLTLDYHYLGNEGFRIYVINDNYIELEHVTSGTVYGFRGKGFIPLKNVKKGKIRLSNAEILKQFRKMSVL